MMSDYRYHIGHRVKQCQRPAITGNGRKKKTLKEKNVISGGCLWHCLTHMIVV